MGQTARDYTEEATALFARFASKHGLTYEVTNAPVEVMWEFPVQPKLSHRIVLSLQNNDELNFGVGAFWSYFFPFEEKRVEFEVIIDKWFEGTARVIPKPGVLTHALELQVLENGTWNSVYPARSLGWQKSPKTMLTNNPN